MDHLETFPSSIPPQEQENTPIELPITRHRFTQKIMALLLVSGIGISCQNIETSQSRDTDISENHHSLIETSQTMLIRETKEYLSAEQSIQQTQQTIEHLYQQASDDITYYLGSLERIFKNKNEDWKIIFIKYCEQIMRREYMKEQYTALLRSVKIVQLEINSLANMPVSSKKIQPFKNIVQPLAGIENELSILQQPAFPSTIIIQKRSFLTWKETIETRYGIPFPSSN